MTIPCLEREEQISLSLSHDLPPETQKELNQHLSQCRACSDYLHEIREDDRLMAGFTDTLTATVERIERKALESLGQGRSARPATILSVPRLVLRNRFSRLALAASIAAIGLISLFVRGSKDVYAQVFKALEKALTVHVTVKSNHDGQWQTESEVWYARGRGVVEQTMRNGETRKRLDNGVNQWVYTSGSRSVMKTKSTDPSGMGVVAKILNLREFEKRFSEYCTGTKTVDGMACKVYSKPNPENTSRIELWIDNDMLVRGWEKSQRNAGGEWQVSESAAVEYNQPVEETRFSPDFGPGVAVIDAAAIEGDKFWEKRFDLQNALYTKEVFGLVFAVHQLKRCEGGLVFLISSIRPTTETIRELGPIDSSRGAGSRGYGDFQLDSSWERLPDGTERSYQPWTLAELNHNGLEVHWDILIPKGSWPEKVNECILSAYIHTRSKLQEKLEKAESEWWRRFRPLTILPLPETTTSLSDVIASVYAEALQLEPVVREILLSRAAKPDPRKEGSWSVPLVKPSQIPPDQYESECLQQLKHW